MRCLHSIERAKRALAIEVIVVDNASSDFDAAGLERGHPNAKVIVNGRNMGFAAAANQGLAVATGDFLLLMNPDAELAADTLEKMIETMGEDPTIGVATARVLLPNGKLDAACRRSFPTPRRSAFRVLQLNRVFPGVRWFGEYNLTYLDENRDAEIDSPCGAFMFVRREAYESVGGLDERFFMYGEDLDWSLRMKRAGWRIVYTARTTVRHEKRASSRQNRPRTVRQFHDAMRTFYGLHYASRQPRIVNAVIYGSIALRERLELLSLRWAAR